MFGLLVWGFVRGRALLALVADIQSPEGYPQLQVR